MTIGRQRTRVGRRVRYFPTAANIGSYGQGDYVGQIIKVDPVTGLADLRVTGPSGTEFNVTGLRAGTSAPGFDFFGGVTP